MKTTQIDRTFAQLVIARAFITKHPNAPGELELGYDNVTLTVYKSDIPEAGKYFGKAGWTRKMSYAQVNWIQLIDGVKVTLWDAEDLNLDGLPVPVAAFPLMLEDSDGDFIP